MKVIFPTSSEIYTCKIDNITKMGIIAYMESDDEKLNTINESPILFIVPNEYIEDDISLFSKGQKIDVEVVRERVKYRTKQIQVVGKLNK